MMRGRFAASSASVPSLAHGYVAKPTTPLPRPGRWSHLPLAKELGSKGITANLVAPGFIDTEMTCHLPQAQR
jgi:hypothetical protein